MAEVTAHSGLLSKTKVHVEDTGRPVVLIHGWPLSGQAWLDQVPALTAAGFRVVAYDRRGFGRSDKPRGGYDYDTLADDLNGVLTELNLRDVSLVGFSMGGGEVARYITRHGQEWLHSVVFAAAVPPYLAQTPDNPDGPLTADAAAQMIKGLTNERDGFFDQFTTQFFSAGGQLKVTEAQRQEALELCRQSDPTATVECMKSFSVTDFRGDLPKITVPTLVLHGNADETVPFEGSGRLTHRCVPQSELVVLDGAPHGCNVSHAPEFNQALVSFLRR